MRLFDDNKRRDDQWRRNFSPTVDFSWDDCKYLCLKSNASERKKFQLDRREIKTKFEEVPSSRNKQNFTMNERRNLRQFSNHVWHAWREIFSRKLFIKILMKILELRAAIECILFLPAFSLSSYSVWKHFSSLFMSDWELHAWNERWEPTNANQFLQLSWLL